MTVPATTAPTAAPATKLPPAIAVTAPTTTPPATAPVAILAVRSWLLRESPHVRCRLLGRGEYDGLPYDARFEVEEPPPLTLTLLPPLALPLMFTLTLPALVEYVRATTGLRCRTTFFR